MRCTVATVDRDDFTLPALAGHVGCPPVPFAGRRDRQVPAGTADGTAWTPPGQTSPDPDESSVRIVRVDEGSPVVSILLETRDLDY